MNDQSKRLPVSQQIRKGLEEAILHAQGKIELNATVLEAPDPPPAVRGEDLVALREARGLSPEHLARVLNVSPRVLRDWERGVSRPTRSALRLIQVLREEPEHVLRVAGLGGTAAKKKAPARGRSPRTASP